MQLAQADITSTIPDGLIPDVESTLSNASRLLGQFEVYGSLVEQGGLLETMLDTDHITVAVLEDLHERTSRLLTNADEIADAGHLSGYASIVNMTMNDQIPNLSDMRNEASALIAEGWELEEDIPALALDLEADIEDPFASDELEHEADLGSIDF
jgi:hypothetical protein